MNDAGLLARKIAIAFAVAFGAALLTAAPDAIGLFEIQDWDGLAELGSAAVIGALAAGFRALVALLTAFVPTDAQNGVNLAGKYAGGDGS